MVKRILIFLTLSCTIGCATSSVRSGADKDAVLRLLHEYEEQLKAGDAAGLEALFAEDAVFMRADAPALQGRLAIGEMARNALSEIALDKRFEIQELVIEGGWAFARANSVGTVTVRATGEKGPEDHDDLFILRRQQDGTWKIARYIYNSNLPGGH